MNRIDPALAHIKPRPVPDPDSERYWKALKDGHLLLQYCDDCGGVQVYHQAICRTCGGTQFAYRPASGYGSVHSFSVVYRAPGPAFAKDTPYAVLLVGLDEGPRMISSLIGALPESVTFGTRVRLVCDPLTDDIALPRFQPVSGEPAAAGRLT
jgi:uncharacterized OB-fold protein